MCEKLLILPKPDIMDSNQGGHFTPPDDIKMVEDVGGKVSMDGKGQCLDMHVLNAFLGRYFI